MTQQQEPETTLIGLKHPGGIVGVPRSEATKKRISEGLKRARKNCVHHWMIESPAGPMSEGKCRKCRAVKTFCNINVARLHDDAQRARISKASRAQWARFRAERDARKDAEADGESRG